MPHPRRQQQGGKWQCTACGEWLDPTAFYPSPAATSGLSSRCKPCHTARNVALRDKANAAAYAREWRQRPEVADRERRRAAVRRQSKEWQARIELNKAVKRGDVVRPAACAECGQTGRIEGHHDDYDKPLDVRWLCRDCHEAHHVAERRRQA